MDNTEGFDQETLDNMNEELEVAMAMDTDSQDFDGKLQHHSEEIFNKYC
jgi:hypothetical protein